MSDFKTELISVLSKAIPALDKKIQHAAVDVGTKPPYAVFSTPEERPIRTLHGIIGYQSTFELIAFHPSVSETENLKRSAIKALDRQNINGQTLYYQSGESGYYPEEQIHSYTLTFKLS